MCLSFPPTREWETSVVQSLHSVEAAVVRNKHTQGLTIFINICGSKHQIIALGSRRRTI
jgi:hypothetical protein